MSEQEGKNENVTKATAKEDKKTSLAREIWEWVYTGEAHPDVICKNPAATLAETVNGGCALQEKRSLVDCVKIKNAHSVTDRRLKRSTYIIT